VAVNSSPFRYALAVSDAEVQFVAHSRRIPGLLALNLSEADTRAHAIDPVLRLLGYNEVSDIRREVPIPATKEFLDYALLVAGQPQVLVEAKALRHPITDQHMGQSVAYAAVLGIEWCLITNGKQWIVCNAYAKGPLESKKVADVTLGGDDLQTAAAWKTLALFARESLMQANPLTELLVDRVLIDELGRGDSAVVAAAESAEGWPYDRRGSLDRRRPTCSGIAAQARFSAAPRTDDEPHQPVRPCRCGGYSGRRSGRGSALRRDARRARA
jgi:hypothetical protein